MWHNKSIINTVITARLERMSYLLIFKKWMNHRIKMFLRNFKKCGKMFWIHEYRFIRWPIRINIQDDQLPHRDTSTHFLLKIDDALNNPIDLFTSLNLTILVWCLRAGFQLFILYREWPMFYGSPWSRHTCIRVFPDTWIFFQ